MTGCFSNAFSVLNILTHLTRMLPFGLNNLFLKCVLIKYDNQINFISISFCIILQELQAFEVPSIITLVDGLRSDNQICVGYKNQFDLINEKNGDTLQLYQVEASKVRGILII